MYRSAIIVGRHFVLLSVTRCRRRCMRSRKPACRSRARARARDRVENSNLAERRRDEEWRWIRRRRKRRRETRWKRIEWRIRQRSNEFPRMEATRRPGEMTTGRRDRAIAISPRRNRFLKLDRFHGRASAGGVCWSPGRQTPATAIDGSSRTMITELVGYHRLLQGRLPVGCLAGRAGSPRSLQFNDSTFLSRKSLSIILPFAAAALPANLSEEPIPFSKLCSIIFDRQEPADDGSIGFLGFAWRNDSAEGVLLRSAVLRLHGSLCETRVVCIYCEAGRQKCMLFVNYTECLRNRYSVPPNIQRHCHTTFELIQKKQFILISFLFLTIDAGNFSFA